MTNSEGQIIKRYKKQDTKKQIKFKSQSSNLKILVSLRDYFIKFKII